MDNKSPLTTLCYIENDEKYLMLHRVSKKNDVNEGKWIGVGGHFEDGESPEECLLREVKEETGLTLTSWKFRGILTFASEGWPMEYICVYTARYPGNESREGQSDDACVSKPDKVQSVMENSACESELTKVQPGEEALLDEIPLPACDEGTLEWVPKNDLLCRNLWEGDLIFLKLLLEDAPFFSLKLSYRGDTLACAVLDGHEMELFDVCDLQGNPTGRVTERGIAHTLGLPHRTAHVWVVRPKPACDGWQVLLQKRSFQKESFPGLYDTSSAGHVQAGDGYLESARRELNEELGIRVRPEELHFCGLVDSGDIVENFNGKRFRDREIAAVYVCFRDVAPNELRLQKEEVDSCVWMDYEVCEAAMLRGDARFCCKTLEGLRAAGKYLRDGCDRERVEPGCGQKL